MEITGSSVKKFFHILDPIKGKVLAFKNIDADFKALFQQQSADGRMIFILNTYT